MIKTISFRRSSLVDNPPVVGALIRSQSGKAVLVVRHTSVFRRAGEPVGRDTIKMEVERLHVVDLPENVVPGPWPIVVKRPYVAPEPMRRIAVAKATVAVTSPSRKQQRRDLARAALDRLEDLHAVVPASQRHAVLDKTGAVVSSPKAVPSTWRDPDDTSPNRRTAKMARGFRRCDPLVTLAKSGVSVTVEHVVAADLYRAAWERGPGGAIAGARPMEFVDRQFSTAAAGPAEHRCRDMTRWMDVQRRLSGPAQRWLQAIVLDGMAVSQWAVQIKKDRRFVTGYLIGILDQLLTIFEADVDQFLRQERVALD